MRELWSLVAVEIRPLAYSFGGSGGGPDPC